MRVFSCPIKRWAGTLSHTRRSKMELRLPGKIKCVGSSPTQCYNEAAGAYLPVCSSPIRLNQTDSCALSL